MHAWKFDRSPKAPAGGERVVAAEVTEARVQPMLRRIPVTRVSDLTPLDPLRLPVFAAVTPLAKDLTTHAGKGSTRTEARVSALMEAVERVCAERVNAVPLVGASFRRLRDAKLNPVDPVTFVLPHRTRYRPDAEFTWVPGFDLLRQEKALVPLDLVTNPPTQGMLSVPDTNGLASGNTHLEAVVHGLCEVIERDAVSQLVFVEEYGDDQAIRGIRRAIDPGSLPAPAARWARTVLLSGLHLRVEHIATDIDVPTFRVTIADDAYPGSSGPLRVDFPGYGTHPDARVAVSRAMTEAIQSRVGAIHGARDAFCVRRAPGRRARAGPQCARSFAEIPSNPAEDLLADYRLLLDRLSNAGFDSALVFDLTRPDLGLPVVRVRVPGLSSFLVNQQRVGWRCLRHLVP